MMTWDEINTLKLDYENETQDVMDRKVLYCDDESK